MFAKNTKTESLLLKAFKEHTIKKFYTCTVVGKFPFKDSTKRAYLKKDSKSNTSYVAVPATQPKVVPSALDGDGKWHTLVLVQEKNALVYYLDGTETFRDTGYCFKESGVRAFS